MTTRNTNSRQGSFERNKNSAARPLVQAYRQVPWRIQTQRGVMILVIAILGISVLWVMLSITVQAGSAGQEIQALEDEQDRLQREIAMLRTNIAIQTSSSQMQQRAEALGFKPVDPADITYMVVPGYKGREPQIQAPPPGASLPQPLVKPAYTQSLWEWFLEGIVTVSEPSSSGEPGGSNGPAGAPVGGSSP